MALVCDMMGPDSDKRILAILGSGQDMLCSIDPDGFLHSCRVERLSFETSDFVCDWILELSFSLNSSLTLYGVLDEDDKPVLSQMIFVSDNVPLNLPIKRSFSFSEAICSLEDIPAHLMNYFGKKGHFPVVSETDRFSVGVLRALVFDALLYGVDYDDSDVRSSFDSFSLRFMTYDGNRDICHMTGRISFSSGSIYVCCQVDSSGLGNKSVRLFASVNASGNISALCTSKAEGVSRPSLSVAFTIAGMLIEEDTVQRRKRETVSGSTSAFDASTEYEIDIDEGCYELLSRAASEERQRIIDNNYNEQKKQDDLRFRKYK